MTLYDDLGVDRSVDADTIKRAYRKKARKAHPDAGGSPEEFRTLSLAYDTLSDADKRARYDETGSTSSTHNEIEQIVSQLVLQAFSRDEVNPMRAVLDTVDQQRSAVKKQKSDFERGLARIDRNLAKFEKANKKTKNTVARDLIVDCLKIHAQQIKAQMDACDKEIAKATSVLTYLNDLKFDGPDVRSTRTTTFSLRSWS